MMLMLIGSAAHKDDEPAPIVVIRFFNSEDGASRVLRLAKNQVRKRYPKIDVKKVRWDVYEPKVAYEGRGPQSGGFPNWVGDVTYYA